MFEFWLDLIPLHLKGFWEGFPDSSFLVMPLLALKPNFYFRHASKFAANNPSLSGLEMHYL